MSNQTDIEYKIFKKHTTNVLRDGEVVYMEGGYTNNTHNNQDENNSSKYSEY